MKSQAFVDRHELWGDEQRRAAAAVEREIKRRKLELIRFSFCDQHGILRGKTLVAAQAASAMPGRLRTASRPLRTLIDSAP